MGLESELLLGGSGRKETSIRTPRQACETILATLRTWTASARGGLLGGREFLQNGGMVMYEAGGSPEHGVLEAATPECSNPSDLARWSVAMDRIVQRAAGPHRRRGVEVFKAGEDAAGNTYGSHENYEIAGCPSGPLRPLFVAAWWLIVAIHVPVLVALVVLMAALLLPIACASLTLAVVVGLFSVTLSAHEADRRSDRLWGGVVEPAMRPIVTASGVLMAIVLLPGAVVGGALLRAVIFRKYARDLPAFLATRILYTGCGALRADRFELSPRANVMRSNTRIWLDDPWRPLVSLHCFAKDPAGAVLPRVRLHVLAGDPTMIPFATYLRFGATALVVSAIERGVPMRHLRLRRPLRAMRRLSRSGDPHTVLEGRRALEIQRGYLEACRAVISADWERQVIGEWERVLDLLETDPSLLYDCVDWVAKRDAIAAVSAATRGDRDAMKRVDLWWHSLDTEEGVYFDLARENCVRRMHSREEILRSMEEPPEDTPAHARAAFVRAHAGRRVRLNWRRGVANGRTVWFDRRART